MSRQLVITIDEEFVMEKAVEILQHLDFISSVNEIGAAQHKISEPDQISLISESSLSEDWLSKEDERWDDLLSN